MIKVSTMGAKERRIFDACNNGWYMGGKYRALFDNHERMFYADSLDLLFHAVENWYLSHEENHAGAHLLVKCVQAL